MNCYTYAPHTSTFNLLLVRTFPISSPWKLLFKHAVTHFKIVSTFVLYRHLAKISIIYFILEPNIELFIYQKYVQTKCASNKNNLAR